MSKEMKEMDLSIFHKGLNCEIGVIDVEFNDIRDGVKNPNGIEGYAWGA